MAIGILTAPLQEDVGIGNSTTTAFTPVDKSLVVVMAAAGWSGTSAISMSVSDSGSHTWTQGPVAIGATNNSGGGAGIWYHYFPTSPGSITITVTYAGFAANTGGRFVDVFQLTGAAQDQSGAGSATAVTSSGGQISVTTTKLGSLVMGVENDAISAATFTANSNTNLDTLDTDTTDGVSMVGWYAKFFSGTPGAVTYGGTWSAGTDPPNIAALEILPALYGPIQIVSSYSGYH